MAKKKRFTRQNKSLPVDGIDWREPVPTLDYGDIDESVNESNILPGPKHGVVTRSRLRKESAATTRLIEEGKTAAAKHRVIGKSKVSKGVARRRRQKLLKSFSTLSLTDNENSAIQDLSANQSHLRRQGGGDEAVETRRGPSKSPVAGTEDSATKQQSITEASESRRERRRLRSRSAKTYNAGATDSKAGLQTIPVSDDADRDTPLNDFTDLSFEIALIKLNEDQHRKRKSRQPKWQRLRTIAEPAEPSIITTTTTGTDARHDRPHSDSELEMRNEII